MKLPIHKIVRRSLTALTLTVGLSVASGAWALDKTDIINLQLAGLDANTIVTVIRSSTEPLTVTPAEVEELRIAGVPQPVLDEICLRVGCGAGPAGPTGPAGPGGADLQRELELQRQQEEERQRLERERMEQERQRMREQIENEQQREADISQAFEGLAIGERYARQGQNIQAAGVYREFLDEVAPAPGSVQYNEALTGFVRAMHSAGYRYSIRNQALEATLIGPNNASFEEMFGILVDISNEVEFLDPNFLNLTDFPVGNYPVEFQDKWNYFLGRFFWIYGEYPRATEFLGRVSAGATQKGQAEYLAGVIALEEGNAGAAATGFQNAILATERNSTNEDISELANLALARLFYESYRFDVALYHYMKIPSDSYRHPRAVFEMAWTYLLKQDNNRAIGTLHSLHSPYYDTWFFPELYVMEAAIYLNTCNLDSATEAILAFSDEIAVLQEPVREFIATTFAPEEYWGAISNYHERIGTPEAVALPIEAVRFVLSDIDFVNQMELIQSLESERDRLDGAMAQLGEYGSLALAGIEADLNAKIIDAGLKISAMISDFEAELTDWYVKSQEVSIEVRTERLSVFDAALSGVEIDQSSSSSVFVLAADWQYWPFEGEYWVDEVDAYRGDLTMLRDQNTGRCMAIDVAAPETAAPAE